MKKSASPSYSIEMNISFCGTRILWFVPFQVLIIASILCPMMIGMISTALAAEEAARPASAPPEQEAEKPRRPLQRLEERILGATPEERARLEEERRRISAAAAAFGTDPTAIIGYYQATYGHNVLTNNVRLDVATATIRVPITPNWLLQVNMPYAWADLDPSNVFPVRGAGDLTMRTGGRLYANENIALFVGMDAWFPTASERQLGTGKYMLGPGGGMAVPLPRLRSLFFTLVQDFNSVGGDSSRPDLHFTQIQSAVNTIWSDHWWSLVSMTWDVDWNNRRKSTMNLLGEVGYRFDNHWNVFAGPGVGVAGRDTPLGLDWTMQAGVRWVYQTPLLPERLLGAPSRK